MSTVTVTAAGESTSVGYSGAAPVLYGTGFGGWFEAYSYTINGKTYSQTETKQQAWNRIVGDYGVPKVARMFGSSIPSYVDPATALVFEQGASISDANLKALQSRQGEQWVTVAHEPENDAYTPTSWGALQNQTQDQLDAGGYSDVSLIPLLMGGSGIPGRGSSQWTAAQWFASCDFSRIKYIGADIYQWGKDDVSADSPADTFGPWIDLAKSLGVQLAVCEVGARRPSPFFSPGISDQAAADYIAGVASLCDANADHVRFLTYFNSNNGASNLKPWNLLPPPGFSGSYRPMADAAWAALCKR
jgi:hypothetical protein